MNPLSLPWLCEISGAVHLAQLGLTAGRQADEIQVNFKILKTHCTSKHLTFRCLTKVQHHYSSNNVFQVVFLDKTYCKAIF